MHSAVGAIFARAPGEPANPPNCVCSKRRGGLLRTVRCCTARLYLPGSGSISQGGATLAHAAYSACQVGPNLGPPGGVLCAIDPTSALRRPPCQSCGAEATGWHTALRRLDGITVSEGMAGENARRSADLAQAALLWVVDFRAHIRVLCTRSAARFWLVAAGATSGCLSGCQVTWCAQEAMSLPRRCGRPG
jgi:hypothetical protein